MPLPVPIAAFDVAADGTARPADNLATRPAGEAAYRWLHFDGGAPELAEWVRANLPHIPAEALLQSETRPRADANDGGLIVNLRGINLNPGQDSEDMVSLRLWVTETLVVSTRMRKVFAADALRQSAENGKLPASVGGFLARLATGLTERIEQASVTLEEAVDELEEAVLENETNDAPDLVLLRRKQIRLRRYIGPQREALTRLLTLDAPFLAAGARNLLRENANRTARAVEELDAVRERLTAISDHLDAVHAQRIGRNSYVLSIVAAIFLPLGFLTGLFGMNVAGLPGTDWRFAFLAVTLAMAGIGLALFLLFRALRWF